MEEAIILDMSKANTYYDKDSLPKVYGGRDWIKLQNKRPPMLTAEKRLELVKFMNHRLAYKDRKDNVLLTEQIIAAREVY